MKVTRREVRFVTYEVDETDAIKAFEKIDNGEYRFKIEKSSIPDTGYYTVVEKDDGTMSKWSYDWDRSKRDFVWKERQWG